MSGFIKLPEYLTRCTLPMRRRNNGNWIKGICGRQLTGAQLARNECPSCQRPFRPSPNYNKNREENRRRRQGGFKDVQLPRLAQV
jgi:hypothetical protein